MPARQCYPYATPAVMNPANFGAPLGVMAVNLLNLETGLTNQ